MTIIINNIKMKIIKNYFICVCIVSENNSTIYADDE